LVASPDGRDGSLTVDQDVDLRPGRSAWVQVAHGAVTLNGTGLKEGDGAAVFDTTRLTLTSDAGSKVLVFDLS
jgi:redox-sensitive bicupin YhaK (pirin superfamily)